MLRLDWNLLFIVIDLLVLYLLMKKFLFKPVAKIIAERQAEADKQFSEAEAKKAEAMDLKSKYELSISQVEQEKVKTIQEARKTADDEYHRIINEASDKAKQLKVDAQIEAENQKTQILKKAEKEIADMVVDAATKVVGGNSGAQVDSTLYNQFLNKAGEK